MTGLIIAASILLFLFLLLLLPVKVFISFEERFFLKVKFLFFPVFQIDESGQRKDEEETKPSEATAKKEKKNTLLKQLFQKKGVTDSIKLLFEFAGKVLLKLKKLLRHFVFDKLIFRLSIASDDAAKTAISYGEICTAAYPVFSFVDQFSNVRYKEIDISADFTAQKTKFASSFQIRAKVIFLLIFTIGILHDFLSFRKQVQNDE